MFLLQLRKAILIVHLVMIVFGIICAEGTYACRSRQSYEKVIYCSYIINPDLCVMGKITSYTHHFGLLAISECKKAETHSYSLCFYLLDMPHSSTCIILVVNELCSMLVFSWTIHDK